MASRAVLLVLCALAATSDAARSSHPSLISLAASSTRHFFSTPEGQIHYVMGGDVNATPPMVLFHANPRSTTEFRQVLAILHSNRSFIAFDYFGQGHSDNCRSCEASGHPVPFDVFVSYVKQVLDTHGVRRFIPFGSVSGASVAIELAVKYASQVERCILVHPIWYIPEAEARAEAYMNITRHPPLKADGSHLIDAWNGLSMKPTNLETSDPGLLQIQEDKTMDDLRSLWVQWQYIQARNDFNYVQLAMLRKLQARTLVIWGSTFFKTFDAAGLNATTQRPIVEGCIRDKQVHVIEYGKEALVSVNASVVASLVNTFLDEKQGTFN